MANAQGNAFRQQGGQAPVGDQGLLEGGLRSSAGLDSLDASTSEIKGMQDGGRRRKNRSAKRKASRSTKRKASRKGRKGRKASRKGRKASRKGRKSTRRQQGGAFGDSAQEVSSPTTLLPADMQKVALGTQSDEWARVANPNTFKPT